eukprot:3050273-Prymnesium_polylepis.1
MSLLGRDAVRSDGAASLTIQGCAIASIKGAVQYPRAPLDRDCARALPQESLRARRQCRVRSYPRAPAGCRGQADRHADPAAAQVCQVPGGDRRACTCHRRRRRCLDPLHDRPEAGVRHPRGDDAGLPAAPRLPAARRRRRRRAPRQHRRRRRLRAGPDGGRERRDRLLAAVA